VAAAEYLEELFPVGEDKRNKSTNKLVYSELAQEGRKLRES
jgi:hypothetical protein